MRRGRGVHNCAANTRRCGELMFVLDSMHGAVRGDVEVFAMKDDFGLWTCILYFYISGVMVDISPLLFYLYLVCWSGSSSSLVGGLE